MNQIEVTSEMIEAGKRELFWLDEGRNYVTDEDVLANIFRAMVSARQSNAAPQVADSAVPQSSAEEA